MNVAGGPLGSVTACFVCHSQVSGGKQIDGLQPNRPGLYPSPGMQAPPPINGGNRCCSGMARRGSIRIPTWTGI